MGVAAARAMSKARVLAEELAAALVEDDLDDGDFDLLVELLAVLLEAVRRMRTQMAARGQAVLRLVGGRGCDE